MIIVPAIDIRAGHCVRLIQGDYARERVYENDPARIARRLLESGARRIHVVDLDAARGHADAGSRAAVEAVLAVAAAGGAQVDVGGGVRDQATAAHWLENGAGYVVLGSVAVRDPETAESICGDLPGRCLVSLDVRGEIAQAEGWTEAAGAAIAHLARWRDWPIAGLIRTEIAHDGMLLGPDLEGLRDVVSTFPHPVFASGGVSTVDDVARVADTGAAGAIVGRAIYEGSFDLRAALLRFPQPNGQAWH